MILRLIELVDQYTNRTNYMNDDIKVDFTLTLVQTIEWVVFATYIF